MATVHLKLAFCSQHLLSISYFWVVKCTFAAEEDYETPTGTQMALSDKELTAITTLEKEVWVFLCTADAHL